MKNGDEAGNAKHRATERTIHQMALFLTSRDGAHDPPNEAAAGESARRQLQNQN
jgi:hypothetical protein